MAGCTLNASKRLLTAADDSLLVTLAMPVGCWVLQVAAVVGENTVEDWTIINLTGDAHPIHLHEVLFEVRH
jgi:FtsP/CotA-like multicopper oxidase with cupredoxin domain